MAALALLCFAVPSFLRLGSIAATVAHTKYHVDPEAHGANCRGCLFSVTLSLAWSGSCSNSENFLDVERFWGIGHVHKIKEHVPSTPRILGQYLSGLLKRHHDILFFGSFCHSIPCIKPNVVSRTVFVSCSRERHFCSHGLVVHDTMIPLIFC